MSQGSDIDPSARLGGEDVVAQSGSTWADCQPPATADSTWYIEVRRMAELRRQLVVERAPRQGGEPASPTLPPWRPAVRASGFPVGS